MVQSPCSSASFQISSYAPQTWIDKSCNRRLLVLMKTCINIPFTHTPVRFMEVAGCTSRDTQIPMLAWCRWSGFLYSNMVKSTSTSHLLQLANCVQPLPTCTSSRGLPWSCSRGEVVNAAFRLLLKHQRAQKALSVHRCRLFVSEKPRGGLRERYWDYL